jgi:hypothetical protein
MLSGGEGNDVSDCVDVIVYDDTPGTAFHTIS